MQSINARDPMADALCYPLLFPYGDMGKINKETLIPLKIWFLLIEQTLILLFDIKVMISIKCNAIVHRRRLIKSESLYGNFMHIGYH